MPITFDPDKSATNVTLPGRAHLSFDVAERFDFDTAVIRQDTRNHPVTGKPYPEPRFVAVGKIGRYSVTMVFTPTSAGFHVISLRPSDRKERKLWLASNS